MGQREVVTRSSRTWLLVAICVVATSTAHAAFLRDVPQELRQPDGTLVRLLATGDEYYNWLHDERGYVVVRDPDTGTLVYAAKVEGRLVVTPYVAAVDDPEAVGLEKGLKPDPRYLPAAEELYGESRQFYARLMGAAKPFSAISNLVIFIRFSDEAEFNDAISTYDHWLNETLPQSTSMRAYFREASYNQLDIVSTYYPTPSGGRVVSFQDSHPRAYYKPYNASTNPDGYRDADRAQREHLLLKAAVDAVSAQIPPALDLDNNGDGFVDSITFVVDGSAVNADWSNLLWPHRWSLLASYLVQVTINGKQASDYEFQLAGTLSGSGVFCHETTHVLGAPDLYRYSSCSSASDFEPVGAWDLMAEETEPPQHMGAYVKYRYLGWIPTLPPITASGPYQLSPLTSASNNCYRINSPNSTGEYFVLEYRRWGMQHSVFENVLPGQGLLVYRIHPAVTGNVCGPPDEVYIYRPGGTLTVNGAVSAAAMGPGRPAITASTDPSPFLSDGGAGGLSLSGVGAAGDTVSFNVQIQQPCTRPGAFSLTAPANASALPASATSATLTWTPAAAAESYDLYFGSTADPPLLGNTSGTSRDVQIVSGATYFWRVAAKNACAQTAMPASGAWSFNVGGEPGVVTILADGFEGAFPGAWQLNPTMPSAGWGKSSQRKVTGGSSAWCAAGGSSPQPAGGPYAPSMNTWMIYGPFSLADAVEASMEFDVWYQTDASDKVWWVISVDGQRYYGHQAWDTNAGWPNWEHVVFNFKDVTTVSAVGAPQVWVAFIFQSTSLAKQLEGAYIDNVVIKKKISAPGPQPRKHLTEK